MRDRLCFQAVVQVRVYVSFRCFLTTKEDTKLQGVKFEGTLKTMMSRCMMCSAIYSCRKTFEVLPQDTEQGAKYPQNFIRNLGKSVEKPKLVVVQVIQYPLALLLTSALSLQTPLQKC